MAAVGATPDAITSVLGQPDDVWIANVNSPRQTVLAGGVEAIDAAIVAVVGRRSHGPAHRRSRARSTRRSCRPPDG